MKTLLFASALALSFSAIATSNNLPDEVDANNVPAAEEAREEEIIDTRDSIDLNETPAELEEREEAEESGWVESEEEFLNDEDM